MSWIDALVASSDHWLTGGSDGIVVDLRSMDTLAAFEIDVGTGGPV